MHECEIDIRSDEVFNSLYEEALHKGATYVEALETQRKRQLLTEISKIAQETGQY